MLKAVMIGQYFPGNSLIHRMDPRIKLISTFMFIFLVFLPSNWVGLGVAVTFFIVCALLSRIPVRMILRGIRPVALLITIMSLLNIFYNTTGATLFQWRFIHITIGGITTAAFMAIRILTVITGSSLLTYTTTPTALTDALERLLSPLKAVRLNVHELAMMMTIALRFIPTLIEETDKIMSAQKARGADIESGGLIKRVKALIPILVPLFISAFRRAYELATAMECRCYRGGDGRTRMKQLKIHASDILSLVMVTLLVAGIIALNMVMPKVI